MQTGSKFTYEYEVRRDQRGVSLGMKNSRAGNVSWMACEQGAGRTKDPCGLDKWMEHVRRAARKNGWRNGVQIGVEHTGRSAGCSRATVKTHTWLSLRSLHHISEHQQSFSKPNYMFFLCLNITTCHWCFVSEHTSMGEGCLGFQPCTPKGLLCIKKGLAQQSAAHPHLDKTPQAHDRTSMRDDLGREWICHLIYLHKKKKKKKKSILWIHYWPDCVSCSWVTVGQVEKDLRNASVAGVILNLSLYILNQGVSLQWQSATASLTCHDDQVACKIKSAVYANYLNHYV